MPEPDLFAADHAAGSLTVTASAWPTLVLEPDERPGWLPSPLAYALHLTGTEPLPPPGNEVRRGKHLEPVAIELLREAGHPPLAREVRVKHKTLPALAWLDAAPIEDSGAYEIKVVDASDYERHWTPAPLYPRIQAQAQMACGGHRLTLIVPLVVGYKSIELGQIVEEPRRDDVVTVLEDAARAFLARLERGELPDPDTSLSSYRALQAITTLRDEQIDLSANIEAHGWLGLWRNAQEARAAGTAAEKHIKQCQAWLAAQAGTASEIVIGDTVLKRKLVERAAHEVASSQYWKWSVTDER